MSDVQVHIQMQNHLARVEQTWLDDFPNDLYVPPEAFAILLERFEGPLDFLLYLVKKNGFDLRQIDVAPIAAQYMAYINLMQQLDVELAGDYLVMAALLADIKSRLLLPRPRQVELEDDPRQNLLERLARYAEIKAAAQRLQQSEILGRDCHLAMAEPPIHQHTSHHAEHEVFAAQLLRDAMLALLGRPQPSQHAVAAEPVDLAERIDRVQRAVHAGQPVLFTTLLSARQGRIGVVVTLIAVLELLRQRYIQVVDDGLSDAGLCVMRLQEQYAQV